MPNHITNRLTINGSPDAVKKVLEAISGTFESGNPMYIDFNRIKPMPESLMIESGSNTDVSMSLYSMVKHGMESTPILEWTAKSIQNMLDEANLPFTNDGIRQFVQDTEQGQMLYKLGETGQSNLEQYGAANWYNWCINEWGTKWNAYEQSIAGNTITFLTAWSGVPELLQQVAAQHPDIEFEYMYADEDWGQNTGEFTFKGADVSGNLPTGGSPEARAIAEELLGPCWHEEDEDELEQ